MYVPEYSEVAKRLVSVDRAFNHKKLETGWIKQQGLSFLSNNIKQQDLTFLSNNIIG